MFIILRSRQSNVLPRSHVGINGKPASCLAGGVAGACPRRGGSGVPRGIFVETVYEMSLQKNAAPVSRVGGDFPRPKNSLVSVKKVCSDRIKTQNLGYSKV